jgi:carbon-monoxide dehydrogenase medium subunit
MKPAPVKYIATETLDDAISVLVEHGDEAKVLAGGQSLIPMLNMRLARPAVLVDVNRIPGLGTIDANGGLTIGALTRHVALLRSDEARAHTPILAEALRHVGHVGIRSRGTVGGSIAHADSAAELPVVLLALDGSVVVQGPRGERTIAASDLFVTNFTTSLEEDEILTHVKVPAQQGDVRSSFKEIARRHGDFGLVLVAAVAEIAGGEVQSARIALGSVADRSIRAAAAEAFLAGKSLEDQSVLNEVARLVEEELDPPSDVHASGTYRAEVAGVLVRRALSDMAAAKGVG